MHSPPAWIVLVSLVMLRDNDTRIPIRKMGLANLGFPPYCTWQLGGVVASTFVSPAAQKPEGPAVPGSNLAGL